MEVTVTQEDIDAGKVDDGTMCPMALAFRRHVGGEPNVGHWSVFIDNVECFRVRQPAREFIQRFDDNEPVKPGKFIFDPDGRAP